MVMIRRFCGLKWPVRWRNVRTWPFATFQLFYGMSAILPIATKKPNTESVRVGQFLSERMVANREFLVALGGRPDMTPGLPPEKWSSLKYGLWPDGGLRNAEEETQGGRDCREAAAG
jgi:hypothetical protein